MLPLRRLVYMLLSFALGLTWFLVLVIGLSVGFSLAITLIGIPLLIRMLWAIRWMAQIERACVHGLIGVDVKAHYRRTRNPGMG